MKKILILIILTSAQFGFSQVDDLSKIISKKFQDNELRIAMNQEAKKNSYFKVGDKIRISALFEIKQNGELFKTSVRGPLPELEKLINDALKTITIPKELVIRLENSTIEKKFSQPINFILESDIEINRRIAKQKRIEKRKNKELTKQN